MPGSRTPDYSELAAAVHMIQAKHATRREERRHVDPIDFLVRPQLSEEQWARGGDLQVVIPGAFAATLQTRAANRKGVWSIYIRMMYQSALFGMCIPALVLPLEGVRDYAFRLDFAASSTRLVWI